MTFRSILFQRPEDAAGLRRQEPDFFTDLALDQIVDRVVAGREEYDLRPFFVTPLRDEAAVTYRHEVLRDLENPPVADAVGDFAARLRRMREHRRQADRLRHRYQRARWFLDAVQIYCDTVATLARDLAGQRLRSRGLTSFRDYLERYVASADFMDLMRSTRTLRDTLASVTYSILIQGNRVRVNKYEGEPDMGAEVTATFAKFTEGAITDHRVGFRTPAEMNHVEERILDLVARLYPEVFAELDDYCARHGRYLDTTISIFDREVQFYLAYLDFIAPLRKAGLAFCYPTVSTTSKETRATAAFDLALAATLTADGRPVVCNDVHLSGPERIIVVTGPNHGGKSTFARMFGQLHHLASIGCPVPGRTARLFLPDRIFTHFERGDSIATRRGRLEDELVRIRRIFAQATGDSVVVCNETFSATTLADALALGSRVLDRLIGRGVLGVYVTFVDELASLGDAVVSMVSTVDPADPTVRTFRVVRMSADGRAHAVAMAERFGLTYQRLKQRIAANGSVCGAAERVTR